MKVVEHILNAKEPFISFEIIPPLRGGKLKAMMDLVETLAAHAPPYIDITSHPATIAYDETSTGIQRRVRRKRPGTLGVCALIQNKYNIDAVPHVLANGFTREETEDFLIELRFLGIDNVLAIRGDDPGFQKPLKHGRTANHYAIDLIKQIDAMNNGEWLLEGLEPDPTDFCIGAAGYPEKHLESPNREADLRRLKDKVDAGADYIVTQMFFDNAKYFAFVDACRGVGIEVPIVPGLKVVTRKRHLANIPRTFACDIPDDLAKEIEEADNKHVRDIGVEWALRQTQDLLDKGVPSVHFYVMASTKAMNQVMAGLKR